MTTVSHKFQCTYCDKCYSKKNSLNTHLILCELKNKTKDEKKIEEEEVGDLPNYSQLVKIVQELSKKYNKLEESLDKMKVWVDNKKKKINIISWLNTSYKCELSFDNWVSQIKVTPNHLSYLFENTIINTISLILNHNLPSLTNTTNKHPIICFSQKANVFYINKPNSDTVSNWVLLNLEEIVKPLKKIQNNLISELIQWCIFK
jgi:hypothetical protein